jgi:Cytochrome c554 and c-prime
VRRLALIEDLKAVGWPVVGVDLGELIAPTGIHRQRELKLQYTMKALEIMGYRAVGLGKNEMAMPLVDALAQHSINNPRPRPLNSTLDEIKKKGDRYYNLNVRPYEIFGVGPNDASPRVGVASLTGPDLEDSFKADKLMKFRNNKATVLPEVFSAFAKEKVDLAMLLHHEYPIHDPDDPKALINPNDPQKQQRMDQARRKMAERCTVAWEAERRKNPAIPPLHLMVILTEEPEPPGVMQRVKDTPTHIIEIGHKGKYVGVVGVFNNGGQWTLKYELVKMDPSFAPKPGQKNAVLDVLEDYARQVRSEEDALLEAYNKVQRSAHPIQVDANVLKKYGGSEFIGSNECKRCHANEWAIWSKTKHAHAFDTLEKAVKPTLRQFDPECIVCHTIGFKYHEGYNQLPLAKSKDLKDMNAAPAAFRDALKAHNAELKNVGCESCHGPASAHADHPKDKTLYPLINPYRPSDAERQAVGPAAKRLFDARMSRLDDFCTKCHDEENDVHWKAVLPKWVGGGIVHNRPQNVGNQWLPPPPPSVQAGNGKKE